MAVKLYTGIMGSGKTYEVVSEVILNSLRQGRRVVSNIAGLNYEAMREILTAEGVPPEKIGTLANVKHEQVLEPLFWRTDKDAEQGQETFIQPGDVVCLDEIWRFWNGFATKDDDGKKRPERVMNFFRMHRQFPHPETGLTCEIALITQDVPDLSRQVRGVLEEIYVMTKLTAIGSTSRYRVDIYSRKLTRKPLRSIQRTYNPKYFPLYSSHSQKKEGSAAAQEQNIDARGNILKGGLFRFVLPLGLVVLLVSAFGLWRMFHPKQQPVETASAEPLPAQPTATKAAPVRSDQVEIVQGWRVVGFFEKNHLLIFVIESGTGEVRQLVNPPNYQFLGSGVSVELPEGGFATSWTKTGQKKEGIL